MIVLAVLGISLYFILREEETQLTDVEKFVKEYTGVDSDNVFVYRHAEEIIRILEHGMGVVQSVNGVICMLLI